MYFRASCICRMDPLVEVIRPNWGLLKLAFGKPHTGWLRKLNASMRNCRACPSLMRKSLWAEKSRVNPGGPIMLLRAALPNE